MKSHVLLFCLSLLVSKEALSLSGRNGNDPDVLAKKTDIEFFSKGILVKGWLFMPEKTVETKLPVIIMAPGLGMVKETVYPDYAESFCKAGFAVILFDFPNFGASGSRNKQEVDPALQVQAYQDAIIYATTLPSLDGDRIGLWGADISGGHVIVVSSLESRVKCFVSMTPYLSGKVHQQLLSSTLQEKFRTQLQQDEQKRAAGDRPMFIPLVGKSTNALIAVPSIHAWDFVQTFASSTPTFQNAVTLKSLELQFNYEPGASITKIKSTPKLFIVAKQDEVIPEAEITDVFSKASNPKQIEYFEGNHFSAYTDKMQEASELAVKFFKENLGKK